MSTNNDLKMSPHAGVGGKWEEKYYWLPYLSTPWIPMVLDCHHVLSNTPLCRWKYLQTLETSYSTSLALNFAWEICSYFWSHSLYFPFIGKTSLSLKVVMPCHVFFQSTYAFMPNIVLITFYFIITFLTQVYLFLFF